jgi:hypothetical protein
MTNKVAISDARAPYERGPSRRAAMIVNPYVERFITAIATAMAPGPRSGLPATGDVAVPRGRGASGVTSTP